MKEVSIIATGSELVNGAVVDTNSAYISNALSKTDFTVKRHVAVADSVEDLVEAVNWCGKDSPIVIITGGLGPTDDDITIEALQRIHHFNLVTDQDALLTMKEVFARLGRVVGSADMKMVDVPGNSITIKNQQGLAPGFILEKGNSSLIALPGVPREMEFMMDRSVLPYLYGRYGMVKLQNMTMMIAGLKESEINEGILEMGSVDAAITWGMTARSGVVTVTLMKRDGLLQREALFKDFQVAFGDNLLLEGNGKPEEEIVMLLKKHDLSLATAESCTGGMIAARITDVPGASRVFKGSVVAYNNDIKSGILQVPLGLIQEFGAVSEAVVGSMARTIAEKFEARTAVSVSGIAGPDGGTQEKPVGTVCFGFFLDGLVQTETLMYPGDRDRVRMLSTFYALEKIRRYLREL